MSRALSEYPARVCESSLRRVCELNMDLIRVHKGGDFFCKTLDRYAHEAMKPNKSSKFAKLNTIDGRPLLSKETAARLAPPQ
jgi:hypothetical protein